MQKKEKMYITPHPDKVLLKITADEWAELFSVWIKRADGTKVQLFTDVQEDEGYEKRFKQNVSVGTVVAVGSNVKGIMKGDTAIIDYLVTGEDSSLVGFHNGHKLVSIKADTTYHTEDAAPYQDGRKAWNEGDYEDISPLLGYVRFNKVIARRPYVFLKQESNTKMQVSNGGLISETIEDVCTREVIAAHPDSGYKEGDMVVLKEMDLFSRNVGKKEISVIMEADLLAIV